MSSDIPSKSSAIPTTSGAAPFVAASAIATAASPSAAPGKTLEEETGRIAANLGLRVAAAVKMWPECGEAAVFAIDFTPKDEVDYTWVVGCAEKEYALAMKIFDDLDTKASALITTGAGSGLLALALIAAMTSTTINLMIIIWMLPTIIFTFMALICAIKCRSIEEVFPPPGSPQILDWVNYYGNDKKVKGMLAAQWYLCTALLRPVNNKKAELVQYATWFLGVAVSLVIIPLAIGIALRLL